jgi:cell division protein FtsX
MGVFEQYPILLIVLIIGVLEGWTAVKTLLRRYYGRRAR